MNYSPDYPMRYRNQNCGGRQNPTTGFSTARRPFSPEYWKETSPRTAECGCGKPESSCNGTDQMAERIPCRKCQNAESAICRTENDTTLPAGECGAETCCPSGKKRTQQCIDTFPVGMTYTPWQVWQELYEIDTALSVGTIFRELDYPWEVGRCARRR